MSALERLAGWGVPGRLRAPVRRGEVHARDHEGERDGQPRRSGAARGHDRRCRPRPAAGPRGPARVALALRVAILAPPRLSRRRLADPAASIPSMPGGHTSSPPSSSPSTRARPGDRDPRARRALAPPPLGGRRVDGGGGGRDRRAPVRRRPDLPGRPDRTRQPAFTGISVLGALGAAAIAVGFVGVRAGSASRRVTIAALAGGSISAIFSGEAAAGISIADHDRLAAPRPAAAEGSRAARS